MIAAKIRLDLNGKKGPDIWARIGEDATRQVVMKPGFYNDEGEFEQLVIDAENVFAKFRVAKPDGTFVIYDASLYLPNTNPAEFVVTLTEEMSQVKGVGYYDLRIGDGETPDTFLYSASGRFIVDDDMITDEMIESVASVNGYVFPDDFLTSEDLGDYVTDSELADVLDDYASKEYVNDAIAAIETIHVYRTIEKVVAKWIDGKDIYEKSFAVTFPAAYNSTGGGGFVIEQDATYIDMLFDARGGFKTPVGCLALVSGGLNANGWRAGVHRNPTGELIIYAGDGTSEMANSTVYLTIQYTKV